MIAFAISLAHWLLISISMSVVPVSSFLPHVGLAGEFLLAADLGDGSTQLVVGLEPILRALDVTLQLRIADIPQGVDAADHLVELEDRAPRRVRLGVGAQLPDQGAPNPVGRTTASRLRSRCA